MKVKRVFNNNVVLAYKDDSEIVVFGKGIGFQKKYGDILDKSKTEKIFTLSENQGNHFQKLFEEISNEYADLTLMIVKQAEKDLQIEFGSNIYIAVMDHINYALTRAKKNIFIKNALLWEIKRTYKNEYKAALNTLELIKKETGIDLPDDEAGTLAIHYFNAQDPRIHLKTNYKAVEVIQNIIKIIQYHFKIDFDDNDMNYNRLMTHLRYFANNLLAGDLKEDLDIVFLFEEIKAKYLDGYNCAMKIRKYVEENFDHKVSDEELTYLIMHIQRIVEKEKYKNRRNNNEA